MPHCGSEQTDELTSGSVEPGFDLPAPHAAGAGHGDEEASVTLADKVGEGGGVTDAVHQVQFRLEVAVAVDVHAYVAAVLAGEVHVVELQPHVLWAKETRTCIA